MISFDVTKLTPAPWSSVAQLALREDSGVPVPTGKYILAKGMKAIAVFDNEADCDEAALSRNALDVMMRRGWHAVMGTKGWKPQTHAPTNQHCKALNKWAADKWFDNPFTALVEADRWYRENVEAKEASEPG